MTKGQRIIYRAPPRQAKSKLNGKFGTVIVAHVNTCDVLFDSGNYVKHLANDRLEAVKDENGRPVFRA